MRTHVLRPVVLAVFSMAATAWWGIDVPAVLAAEAETPERRETVRESQRDSENRGARRGAEGVRQRQPGRPAVELQEARRGIEKAMAELQELRAAGKEEAAVQKKREVQELQEKIERLRRQQPEFARGPVGERPSRRDREARPPMDGPEQERKLQHLRAAIENLHAAGMHEPADRLARQAEMMRGNQPRPPGGPRPGPLAMQGPDVHRLQAEVEDLRHAVAALKARLDELARENRGR